MFLINLKVMNNPKRSDEKGAALAIAIIVLVILAVIAMTALAFSSTEARIAGSDLQRTQTFYAASTGLEKMTNDFSNLFREKMNPTPADLNINRKFSPAGDARRRIQLRAKSGS